MCRKCHLLCTVLLQCNSKAVTILVILVTLKYIKWKFQDQAFFSIQIAFIHNLFHSITIRFGGIISTLRYHQLLRLISTLVLTLKWLPVYEFAKWKKKKKICIVSARNLITYRKCIFGEIQVSLLIQELKLRGRELHSLVIRSQMCRLELLPSFHSSCAITCRL